MDTQQKETNLPLIAPTARFICFITCLYCLLALYNDSANVEAIFIVSYLLLAALMFVEPLDGLEVIGYILFFLGGGLLFIVFSAFSNIGAGMVGPT